MKSVENSLVYEILDMAGEVAFQPFFSKKSLEQSIAAAQKQDSYFHENYKVRVYIVSRMAGGEDLLIPAPKHLCEDCGSPEHVEGSEACRVSYPEGV